MKWITTLTKTKFLFLFLLRDYHRAPLRRPSKRAREEDERSTTKRRMPKV
jgi:hypothetical protein